MIRHMDKLNYSIYKDTEIKNIDNYLLFKDGFTINEDTILYSIENKKKVEALKEKYEFVKYRLKYKSYSLFFTEQEFKNSQSKSFLTYEVISIDKKRKVAKLKVPVNTKINSIDGSEIIESNNLLFAINIDTVNENLFDLPKDSKEEFDKTNGKIINYINKYNEIYLNTENEYINISEAIEKDLIKFKRKYQSNNVELKNVLLYNNRVIGKIELANRIDVSTNFAPMVSLSGVDIELTVGIAASLENMEELISIENNDQLTGAISYNQYNKGDVIYAKDVNKLYLVANELLEIDIYNTYYSYKMPEFEYEAGQLWADLNTSALFIYDGMIWKLLSKPSLLQLSKKIELDNIFETGINNSLELYGTNNQEDNTILEMVISKNIVTDIEFPLGNQFIDNVYVNGKEITNFHEAGWGIHFFDALKAGDHVQLLLKTERSYRWFRAKVVNNTHITVNSPYEINYIQKVIVNNKSYFVNEFNNNIIALKDLISFNNEDISITECDKVYVKAQISDKLSDIYPKFKVEYKESKDYTKVPFNMARHRFDEIMITNNGQQVIINAFTIFNPDDLYAYYDLTEPDIIRFNRLIRPEDNIIVQFVSNSVCLYNPESTIENLLTEKDIDDKLILMNALNPLDDKVTITSLDQQLLDYINRVEDEEMKYAVANIGSLSELKKNEIEELQSLIDDYNKASNPDRSATAGLISPVIESSILAPTTVDGSTPELTIPPGTVSPEQAKDEQNLGIKIGRKELSNSTNIDNFNLKHGLPSIASNSIKERSAKIDKENKYNFYITKEFMHARKRLKEFLYNMNDRLKATIDSLNRIKDALRNLVNYLCNILCLEDILRLISTAFNNMLDALVAFFSLSWDQMLEKIKNFFISIGDKIKDAFQKFKELLDDLFGNVLDKFLEMWEKFKEALQMMFKKLFDFIDKVVDNILGAFDKIAALFNFFRPTMIGKNIDKIKSAATEKALSFTDKLANSMNGFLDKLKNFFVNIGDQLSTMWDKLMNLDIVGFIKSIDLAGVLNLICNKILKAFIDLFENALQSLEDFQRRYQNLLDKMFTDTYRSPFNDLDKLHTCAEFFKCHMDICDIIKSLLSDPDGPSFKTLIKKVTNLDKILKTWKYNKEVIKGVVNNMFTGNQGHPHDFASAFNTVTNTILTIDELAAMNHRAIENIIRSIKQAFSIDFKKNFQQIFDMQIIGKQIFNKDTAKDLWDNVKRTCVDF